MSGELTLSPSQLGNFRESPRAFWLEKNHAIKRPQGIFSAMPNAIDAIIKGRYDGHRGKTVEIPNPEKPDEKIKVASMPSELARLQKRGACLFTDYAKLRKMRAWRSAPVFVDPVSGGRLSGMVDDLLVVPSDDGKTVVCSLDIKTTKLRDELGEYSAQYYLLGQSCYHLLLDTEFAAKGFATHKPEIHAVGDRAALAYYMPDKAPEGSTQILSWKCELVTMPVDRELALEVLRAAIECLAGPLPAPGPNEDWDDYISNYTLQVRTEERKAIDLAERAAAQAAAPATEAGAAA